MASVDCNGCELDKYNWTMPPHGCVRDVSLSSQRLDCRSSHAVIAEAEFAHPLGLVEISAVEDSR